MVKRYVLTAALLLLAACSGSPAREREVITVEVPVPVHSDPPAWLAAPYQPERLPLFIHTDSPEASSALSVEGETALRLMLFDLLARDRAWRAWAGRQARPP